MRTRKTRSNGKSFPRAPKDFWWIEKSLEYLGQQQGVLTLCLFPERRGEDSWIQLPLYSLAKSH